MKILSKLSKVKNLDKIRKKFFVLDIETFGRNARPEEMAICCIYGFEYKKVFYSPEAVQEEIFNNPIFRNKYVFCHFAEFDYNGIFGNIKKNLDREAIFNGSTFIMASHPHYTTLKRSGEKIQKGKVTFADSYNIYKAGVKDIGKIMGIDKKEMGSRFGSGQRFKVSDEEIEYCYTDCEIVWKALEKIFLMVQSVRSTLASLSMLYYRRFYMPHAFAYNDLSLRFFESYYGGRVEAFKIGKTLSSKFDINSMYPYVMTFALFPNPKFVKESDSRDLDSLLDDMRYYEGQTTLTVEHESNNFGFLPLKKDGKLIFPNGKFTGTWCFPEIRYALECKAIKVLQVHDVLISYKMKSPFKDFANDLYNKRLKSEGAEKEILKILLNANYGKWGQREKFKEIYFDEIPLQLIDQLNTLEIPYEIKTFNKKRKDCYLHIYAPVNIFIMNGEYVVEIDKKGFSTKIHSIPAFSSYITSHARVYLLQQMRKYRNKSITYVDTDCICLEREVEIPDSKILGAFKKEKEYLTEIFGNKNYIEVKNGEINRKTKGVPKKAIQVNENTFKFDTFVKTKRAIRQQKNAGTIEETTKQLTNEYTKRNVNEKGKTTPLILTG